MSNRLKKILTFAGIILFFLVIAYAFVRRRFANID